MIVTVHLMTPSSGVRVDYIALRASTMNSGDSDYLVRGK